MQNATFLRIFRMVQIATVAVFWGRAWQHIVWDAPYRALLWDQSLMEGLVKNFFGLSWEAYVANPAISNGIDQFKLYMGLFFVLCGFLALFLHKIPRISRPFLYFGGFCLIFLSFLYYKEKFMAIGQFWEYTLQWSSPFFLVYLDQKQSLSERLIFWFKVAIALTFTCHGLYALGYYPRPGYFLEMVMNILSVSDQQAIHFLNFAGIMDFVISILIFLPYRSIAFGAMLYAAVWGFATTIARVWAYFHWQFWQESLNQWLHESIMRFPHFLIPIAVLIYWYYQQKDSK